MRFKVLLILQHLCREILVGVILDVHTGSVKIKYNTLKICDGVMIHGKHIEANCNSHSLGNFILSMP